MADGFADGVVAGMASNDRGFGGYGYGYPMPVMPMNYGGFGNSGFGFGGEWIWIILLFVLFGNGGFGFGGGMDGGFPWLLASNANNQNATQNGFNQAAISSTLAGLQNSITTGFSNAEVSACNRALDNLNRSFDAQTAVTNGLYNVNSSLQNCCCENRAGLADLKYTIATENCADRNTSTQNTQTILTAMNAGIQSIKDQMCQDKIDEKNDVIAQLRQEVLYARGQASQDVQTARILAGQTNEVDALYNRLNACPVGTVPVYGRTPIFNCNGSCNCGNNNI